MQTKYAKISKTLNDFKLIPWTAPPCLETGCFYERTLWAWTPSSWNKGSRPLRSLSLTWSISTFATVLALIESLPIRWKGISDYIWSKRYAWVWWGRASSSSVVRVHCMGNIHLIEVKFSDNVDNFCWKCWWCLAILTMWDNFDNKWFRQKQRQWQRQSDGTQVDQIWYSDLSFLSYDDHHVIIWWSSCHHIIMKQKRPNTCYIFEKEGTQGYQIWYFGLLFWWLGELNI